MLVLQLKTKSWFKKEAPEATKSLTESPKRKSKQAGMRCSTVVSFYEGRYGVQMELQRYAKAAQTGTQ